MKTGLQNVDNFILAAERSAKSNCHGQILTSIIGLHKNNATFKNKQMIRAFWAGPRRVKRVSRTRRLGDFQSFPFCTKKRCLDSRPLTFVELTASFTGTWEYIFLLPRHIEAFSLSIKAGKHLMGKVEKQMSCHNTFGAEDISCVAV